MLSSEALKLCHQGLMGGAPAASSLHFRSNNSNMQCMFARLLRGRLRDLARQFPALVILGARQVGKTTLARAVFADFHYADLEDPRTAQRFSDDPRYALDTYDGGLVLDEAQAVPELFAALRGAIDADRSRHARFVLLGSAQ